MKKVCLVVLLLLVATPALAAEKVVLATLDWEPYIGQSMKDQGYVAAVVREAFKRGGYEVELQFNQWTRTVGLAKSGQVDGYLPEYYAEEIKEYASFSDPFSGGPLGFFKLKSSDVSYTSLQDLKGLKIGTVKGYANTAEFDAADFLAKEPAKDDLTNFKKLAAGRLDLVVADKFVGMQILQKEMPEKADDIVFVDKSLEDKDLYVCISKKSTSHDAALAAVNKGLAEMKADGSIDRILKKYGF
jgi:polar amino acid transport system substrate-binding protein